MAPARAIGEIEDLSNCKVGRLVQGALRARQASPMVRSASPRRCCRPSWKRVLYPLLKELLGFAQVDTNRSAPGRQGKVGSGELPAALREAGQWWEPAASMAKPSRNEARGNDHDRENHIL